ncbi:MAG: alpha/beta hydrolase [Cycloclasticus sp. symbiont of Poecilosclerida sp. N]|nr:MAG: alpha/beta hydrolase [Cycloclasticus sp. symbiont of Poecilosclerida sp. N]
MPFLKLESLNLHYEHQTKGDTPIIFLHGNFGSWHYWQPFLQNLPDGYCGYAPDFRGCGESQVTDNGYDIKTLSKDILAFADQLELEKFHLVGHSLGGAVAQELAGRVPERIITLTLVSPAPAEGLKSLANVSLSDSIFSAKNIFRSIDRVGLKRKLISISFRKSMPRLAQNKTFFNQALDDATKMDIKAFSGFLKTLKQWNGEHLLQRFNFPVLIMYGELDSVISLQSLKKMEQHINNCIFHTFRHVGHAPQLEQPKAFNKLLSAFIRGKNIKNITESKVANKPTGLFKKLTSKLKYFFK